MQFLATFNFFCQMLGYARLRKHKVLQIVVASGNLNVCEISGCSTETDISYYGNDVNDGTSNVQSDVPSCRSSCKSMGADYFGFNYGGNKQCWCKNSNAGRMQQFGVVSGETSCPGEDSFVVYQKQGCIN